MPELDFKTVFDKFGIYFIGALSIVVAFAWNEAVKLTFNKYFPVEQNNLKSRYIYASTVTIIMIGIVLILSKIGINTGS